MVTDPNKKYQLKLVLKIKKLKNMTKNGYAISKTEAVGAPSILIPEKIKKFARVAKTTEVIIRIKLTFPELNNVLTD